MKCSQCTNQVPTHLRECPSCGMDCGFPNVRLVNQSIEISALEGRVDDAYVSAKARGCEDILTLFGDAVKNSKVVICRSMSDVNQIVKDETNSYSSFQRQVQSGSRTPQDNEFDKVRKQYEEALYPHFSEKIIFGSLSLNQSGMSGYGGVTMVLKDAMISKRTSVFEENPHVFVDKHKIAMNKPLPVGYRADWQNRNLLAIAKLHSEIDKTTAKEDFASVLQNDTGGTETSDFIEAHIYGTINRNAIELAIATLPKTKVDRAIWEATTEILTGIGIKARTI